MIEHVKSEQMKDRKMIGLDEKLEKQKFLKSEILRRPPYN